MVVYIYSNQPLEEARGDLEDDLGSFLGRAECVTGGGAGEEGWNIAPYDWEEGDPIGRLNVHSG